MKKIILAFMGLALIFSSCEDFLTKEPAQNPRDEEALSSFTGIDNTTNGNYIGFASWYGELVPLTFDLMCGNAMVGPVNTGRMRGTPAWDFTPDGTLGIYAAGYNVILGCNKVLTAIEQNEFTRSSSVTQADINNIKAENHVIRAISYFDMVRIYGQSYSYITDNGIVGDAALGVPLIKVYDLYERPARATVAQIYEFIIDELKLAEQLMEDNYQRTGVTDVRATISKPVIQAILARVYLEHQDYQLAADYATKVINNKAYKLLSGNDYLAMWDGTKDCPDPDVPGEIIFELYISKSDNSSSGLGDYLHAPQNADDGGYGDVRLSNDLTKLYGSSDIRLSGLTEKNSYQDYSGKYRWSTKYPGKNGESLYNNVPIIRISEMYLLRAEAIAQGASVAGRTALDDLNEVAKSRKASEYSDATLPNIFTETRKEFVFEGHVFFDMKRLQLPLQRDDVESTQNQNVEYPSYRWALPIPQHEIDANPNIKQNPGYNVK